MRLENRYNLLKRYKKIIKLMLSGYSSTFKAFSMLDYLSMSQDSKFTMVKIIKQLSTNGFQKKVTQYHPTRAFISLVDLLLSIMIIFYWFSKITYFLKNTKGPRKGLFGIPGGRSDAGQFLQKTAQRQLFEETGIISKFQHFVYFRFLQNTVFGAGDLYFVCLMKAEEESMRKIKLCER